MADDHPTRVARIASGLAALGRAPVLIGGMALVVFGSRRVTRDFDLVIPALGEQRDPVLRLLYREGLQLVARLDADGRVLATISTERVAAARLGIDRPHSAIFFDAEDGLRIDLLFDFPMPAAVLSSRAIRTRLGRSGILVASEADLLALKRLAAAERDAPGDAEDIRFLEKRLAVE